jgi:hypothetical protein
VRVEVQTYQEPFLEGPFPYLGPSYLVEPSYQVASYLVVPSFQDCHPLDSLENSFDFLLIPYLNFHLVFYQGAFLITIYGNERNMSLYEPNLFTYIYIFVEHEDNDRMHIVI